MVCGQPSRPRAILYGASSHPRQCTLCLWHMLWDMSLPGPLPRSPIIQGSIVRRWTGSRYLTWIRRTSRFRWTSQSGGLSGQVARFRLSRRRLRYPSVREHRFHVIMALLLPEKKRSSSPARSLGSSCPSSRVPARISGYAVRMVERGTISSPLVSCYQPKRLEPLQLSVSPKCPLSESRALHCCVPGTKFDRQACHLRGPRYSMSMVR